MKNIFYRLPLLGKLAIIGLIPVIFLVYFAVQIQKEKRDKLEVLSTFINRLDRSAAIMDAINQLQLERRLSFIYVLKPQDKTELVLQRQKTDVALQSLKNVAEVALKNFYSYTFLENLTKARRGVDNKTLQPADVMTYYTNVIFRINTFINITTDNNPQLQYLNNDLISQRLLSEMSTYLGLMRSYLYYAMYFPSQSNVLIPQVKQLDQLYNTYAKEFETRGSPSAIADYKNLRTTTELRATLDYIERTIAQNHLDSTYTTEEWWNVSANGVDRIRDLQKTLLSKVETNANAVYETEKINKELNLIYLIAIIAFVTFIIFYISKAISDNIAELREVAEKMASGLTGIKPDIRSKDVIGKLSSAISKIDETNILVTQAADAIGKGNFDIEIKPRSEEDVLGNAIIRMRDDLLHYKADNEKEIWIQTGLSIMNESVLGEKTMSELSVDVLTSLVKYLNADVGLFYNCNNDRLEYLSGYAINNEENIRKIIPLGETLLGRVAIDKKILYLKDHIHADSLKISTGLTQSSPVEIIIIPIVYNKRLKSVIEIASLKPFYRAVDRFLPAVADSIGIAMHAAKNRAKVQELLEETQAQAEELQAQHNELEHINTELEAQTQKLQVSEEELRVQQEELMQANRELEERSSMLEERNQVIVERNIEIRKKAEELERTTRYKSEFLANMSHELRTPLNSILLLSRLLSENKENNLTKEQVQFAEVIQNSGNGLLSLIDEILDLSKIEAGKMTLEYNHVSIKEIVDDIVSLFKPMALQKNLELIVEVDPATPSAIDTDQMRVEQVLKNLISNALKFTTQGSITMDIKPKDNLFITFSVRDTGIGIPKDKQNLIFEAFQQADGSTRRKYGGTGLGLSISRQLVALLGGEIRLNSEPGKGSEFSFDIPVRKISIKEISEPELAPVVEELKEETGKTNNTGFIETKIPEEIPDDRNEIRAEDKVILIVEDDTLFATALLGFARQSGYKGLVAVRGDQGVELAKTYRPMAILLDIRLPVKDGWQVMEELKSNSQTRHIPVHIMSSLSYKKESLMKGAIDFIGKPVSTEQMREVFQKIEEVLARHPKKVLIVEENPKHASALSFYLQSFNINTQQTADIHQSVDALKQKEVDCVILDMGMPNQQSYETLEEIKKNQGLENLPIIIFTGKSLSRSEEQRIKQYADSIVVKTAHSYKRILDEVGLFLHLVEENKPQQNNGLQYKRLGALSEVLNNKTVLIADDDVRNIFSLTKALEAHKMNVLSATDGKEALEVLQQNSNVDIVLMDMMMPEMDGYEATAAIRQNPRYRNLPILAVTAKAMTGDREKCIKAGASDYITKPVDVDQLLSLLRVWLYDKGM